MLKTVVLRAIWGFVILSVPFTLVFSQTQNSLDIPTLLREVKQRSDENWHKMRLEYPNYTYKWLTIWRKAGMNGKPEETSELWEFFHAAKCRVGNCTFGVQIAKNGKPLAAKKIEKQRTKVGKKLEKVEGDAQATMLAWNQDDPPMWMMAAYSVGRPYSKDWRAVVSLDGQEVLEKGDFIAQSLEIVYGREMIALSFRPRAGAVFSEGTKYMPQIEGKLWIDAEDKILTRLAMWPRGTNFHETTSDYLLEHAALGFDMTRAKEGIWFNRFSRINGLSYPNLFTEMKSDFIKEQFDLQYFKTEVKSLEINAPVKSNQ